MGRVLLYWLVLSPLAAVTTYATALLFFRSVDLSFGQFATLLCAPMAQAIVLAWREARPADTLATLGWSVARHPLAQPVLVLDGLVIGTGLVGWEWHVWGFGATVNIHATWAMVKAIAAVVFCTVAVLRATGRSRQWIAWQVSAPLLLVFALEPSTSWLAALFSPLHEQLGTRAEVVERLAFYVPVFAGLIGLTLRSARQLQRSSREAGWLLHLTVAASVAVAIAVVLATFNLPTLTQPWLGVASLAASLGATTSLLASILLATASSAPPEVR
jgi:hypothetical protein